MTYREITKQFPNQENPKSKISGMPTIFIRQRQPVSSIAYETYWKFATERQKIFFERINNTSPPWTNDPILSVYKFTNAYRASDRVSQYLIKHVIYEESYKPNDQFFRIMLFKLFNRIETWELLESELGPITWEAYEFSNYDKILNAAFHQDEKIYSAAYIIPSPQIYKHKRKHQNHLKLIEEMIESEVPERLQKCRNMREAFLLLKSFHSIGDFLAYQFITDINYGTLTNFSEMTFVVPGPGAKDGIRKCFTDYGDLTEKDLIKLMADRQEEEFTKLGLDFINLWGRPLQLIDCQNLFCEVDKYSRVAHPDLKGISGRLLFKQKFRSTKKRLKIWYPPKWGINQKIKLNKSID